MGGLGALFGGDETEVPVVDDCGEADAAVGGTGEAEADVKVLLVCWESVDFAVGKLIRRSPLREKRAKPCLKSKSVIKPATRTIVVPRPKAALIGSASQAADIDLVEWVNTWVSSVVASS